MSDKNLNAASVVKKLKILRPVGDKTEISDADTLSYANYKISKEVYPDIYAFWKKQLDAFWTPDEIPLHNDIKDFNSLSPREKLVLSHIVYFFVHVEIAIQDSYICYYSLFFQPPIVRLMINVFAFMESIHSQAYQTIQEVLSIASDDCREFLDYPSIIAKMNYFKTLPKPHNDTIEGRQNFLVWMAYSSAFNEGVQLFTSFAVLLNFQRYKKMCGLGQLVTFSIRDETLHVDGIANVFRRIITEQPELWTQEVQDKIYKIADDVVKMEDNFIDEVFSGGDIPGLTKEEMKGYIRQTTNDRLEQLTLAPRYKLEKEEYLSWMATMINGNHVNFFEQRPSNYRRLDAQEKDWENLKI